jgi:hypothetical protein
MPDNRATAPAQNAIAASVSALLPGPEWLRPLTENRRKFNGELLHFMAQLTRHE